MTLPGGVREHREKAEGLESLRGAIVTVSDTRTEATDESGKRIRQLLEEAGHIVVSYRLLPNDQQAVTEHVQSLLSTEVDVILLTGGTGLGRKDRTVEAVRGLLERELPGFGELFRLLSYQEQVGTAAILSRALCGSTAGGKIIVALPGSRAAVDLALTRILLPELRHMIYEIRR